MIEPLMSVSAPLETESATAFLLRSFAANRVTPKSVYRWLGLRWTEDLRPAHLEVLSHVSGAPLAWLRPRTVSAIPGDRWQRSWCGQLWRNPSAIRTRQFWVCCFCLHEEGSCRLEWDLACFSACPIHRAVLTDRCSHCGHSIRWQRPSVDVCSCRRHFKSLSVQDETFSPLLELWLRWVSDTLSDPLCEAPMSPDLSELFPGHPSVDGTWRVIHALGVRPDRLEDETRVGPRDAVRPVEAYGIARRGLSRLVRLREGGDVTESVQASALRWQALRGITFADRALADHLLETVEAGRGRKLRRRVGKGNQLELF